MNKKRVKILKHKKRKEMKRLLNASKKMQIN
jgi:hypothetical protein